MCHKTDYKSLITFRRSNENLQVTVGGRRRKRLIQKSLELAGYPLRLLRRIAQLDRAHPMKRILLGASWSLVGTVLSQVITLLASILLARRLETDAFGQYALISSTLGVMTTLFGFGLGQTAAKYLSEFKSKDPSYAGNILAQTRMGSIALSTLGCALVWSFANPIASTVLAQPELEPALKSASFLLAVTAFTSTQNGALSGFEAFSSIAMISVIRAVSNAIMVCLFTPHWGLTGAIWASAGSMTISAVVAECQLKRLCNRYLVRASSRRWTVGLSVFWRYSVPTLMSAAITSSATMMALRSLSLSSGGLAEVAVFNVANQWRLSLLLLPALLGQVTLPILSSLHGPSERNAKIKVIKTAILANTVVALGAFIFFNLFAGPILRAYGKTYEGRHDVMIVLLLSTVLLAAQTPIGTYIAASAQMWVGFAYNLAWGTCLIATNAFLISLGWGAKSLATAYLVAYLFHGLYTGSFAVSLLRRESV